MKDDNLSEISRLVKLEQVIIEKLVCSVGEKRFYGRLLHNVENRCTDIFFGTLMSLFNKCEKDFYTPVVNKTSQSFSFYVIRGL